jgi:deoxyadenosine/deoxycytidine kinase
MKVRFKQNIALSYDGLNSRLYEKGKEYEAGHAQEKRAFKNAVDTNYAEYVVEATPTKETKVLPPKSKK